MSTKKIRAHPTSRPPSQGDHEAGRDRGNLLGALLRLAYHAMMAEVMEALSGTQFTDLQAMHMTAFRPLWDAPQGLRATELAAAARITKQSIGIVVDQLEEGGYVERVAHPSDGRAKLVRLTKRGREAGGLLRAAVRRVEADWAQRIGSDRLAELRSTLTDLVASLDRDRS
jgi:DNA-binding MarR family transcriptional regulator